MKKSRYVQWKPLKFDDVWAYGSRISMEPECDIMDNLFERY